MSYRNDESSQRREVLYQFLIEAVLISGIGAVIGILIAVSVPVQPLLPGNLRLFVSRVSVTAFLVASFTGVLFGYLPANKAAQLQLSESLRYE